MNIEEAVALTGSKFLPRLDVPTSLEADCRSVHQIRARRVDEEAEQHCIHSGRVREGLRQPALGSGFCLSATSANGSQLQNSSNYARGRQFSVFEQVSAPYYIA